jgi:hypothetical protein
MAISHWSVMNTPCRSPPPYLRARDGVLRRILLCFPRTIIDGDFLTANLDLDAVIIDVPIAHRTFLCVHHNLHSV